MDNQKKYKRCFREFKEEIQAENSEYLTIEYYVLNVYCLEEPLENLDKLEQKITNFCKSTNIPFRDNENDYNEYP